MWSMRCLVMLSLLVSSAQAATRSVVPSGGVSSGTCISPASACTLAYAVTQAVQGDEVVLANGTYTAGAISLSNNNGSPGLPITIRAANLHQAIVDSTATCANTVTGFDVNRDYWTIRGLRFRDQSRAIYLEPGVDHITIEDNIFEGHASDAIFVHSSTFNTIRRNVFAFGTACTTNNSNGAIMLVTGSNNNTIESNIIVGNGRNGYSAAGISGANSVSGVGIYMGFGVGGANDNVAQGNLILATNYTGLRVIGDSVNNPAVNNIVRDNFIILAESGGSASDDCSDDSNQFLNNFIYGNYYTGFTTKGQTLAVTSGHHILQHNTSITTPFSRHNWGMGTGTASGTGCNTTGGTKIDLTFKDNLLYQDFDAGGEHVALVVETEPSVFCSGCKSNNLVWVNDTNTADWSRGYTYVGTDIHSFANQPLFANPSGGDFRLCTGSGVPHASCTGASPGVGAASDSTDIGIAYNSFLRKSWSENIFGRPTAQQSSLQGTATSVNFTGVSTSHFYQVHFYIPDTGSCSITEQFTIEGVTTNLARDMNLIKTDGAEYIRTPARWIGLGRHKATDGTLTVSWTNNNCVDKVHIRQLPTADEAYQLILAAEGSVPAAPANLRVISP